MTLHAATPRHLARAGLAGAVLMLALLPGCTTRATTDGASNAPAAFAIDQEVTIDGRVTSMDMTPWTYDGSAILLVATSAHGPVKVQLPARWNLCRAKGIDTAAALRPGDRVQVAGIATDTDTLTVCEGAGHRVERL